MKTKGLNFEEAVRALHEKKCEKIMPENCLGISYGICGGLLSKHGCFGNISLAPENFLGKWELIGIKPRTEERISRCWLVVYDNGVTESFSCSPPLDVIEVAQHVFCFVKAYTYTYPEEVT